MNIRWLHSQRILVVSLATALLAVGVLTSLVIRQQQGQADGQRYLETGGTVSAKPVVPVIGQPTMVGGNVGSAGAPVQAAGADERADDKGGSQVRCPCGSPPPATMIQPKVQPIHRSTPKRSSRSQRIAVNHGDPPAQPHPSGSLYQPTLPEAGPPPDEVERPEKVGPSGEMLRPGKIGPSGEAQRPEKIGPSGEAQRPEKIGPSGEAQRPDEVGPSGPPTPRKGR
jgi:hypothetical protein